MTVRKLVRLNFGRNPTHFGEVGIGLEQTSERVRSDTLFSAWVSSYARIFGKDGIEQLLGEFNSNLDFPPFRISSTFIYRRNGNGFIDYLPKPVEYPIAYPEHDSAIAKTYRKLNYLPLSVWQRWYQGDGFDAEDEEELIQYSKDPKDKAGRLSKAGIFSYSEAFKPYELPKVSIDPPLGPPTSITLGWCNMPGNPSSSMVKTLSCPNRFIISLDFTFCWSFQKLIPT